MPDRVRAPRREVGSLAGVAERRAAGRSVGLEQDARFRRSRIDQLHVVRLAPLGEQPEPIAHDDGVDPQVELIDEVALEKPPKELAAAMELELASWLRLELSHGRL